MKTRAFNAGSQARIEGLPRHRNDRIKGTKAYYSWFDGWDQVDAEWGHDSKGTAKPLPVLVGR